MWYLEKLKFLFFKIPLLTVPCLKYEEIDVQNLKTDANKNVTATVLVHRCIVTPINN